MKAQAKVEDLTRPLELALPIVTRNELNSHEHWRFRSRRAKAQRFAVAMAVQPHAFRLQGMFPLLVTFTRIFPGAGLDAHDGLPASGKHCIDGLCDALGMSDRDERISFRYAQRSDGRGKKGIEIRIETKEARHANAWRPSSSAWPSVHAKCLGGGLLSPRFQKRSRR